MINISVPESFALDYLSILEIKLAKKNTLINESNYFDCLIKISNQIKDLNLILEGVEYDTLYDANLAIFETIDAIHNGKEMSAKELDSLNYKRFEAKQIIQKKFFDNTIEEVKIGYK